MVTIITRIILIVMKIRTAMGTIPIRLSFIVMIIGITFKVKIVITIIIIIIIWTVMIMIIQGQANNEKET